MSNLFVLAAGGSGGHLFPAQALATELMRRGRSVVVMTDARGHNFGKAFPGAEIKVIPAANFSTRSPIKLIGAAWTIGRGILAARAELRRLRPRAVVGFGGYSSLPVMIAAKQARIPSAVHEQNSVPGRVNRFLSRRVARVAASFPFARFAPENPEKIVFTGLPVRAEVMALRDMPFVAPGLNDPINILIFGGSQGARALSEVVPRALARLPVDIKTRLHVTQQARVEDLDEVKGIYREANIKAEVETFYTDLPRRMAAAHLVVARSGASTLGELTVIGRPSILVPYPFAMDDHQTANADVLEKAGAAWVFKQNALDPEKLSSILDDILLHPEQLTKRAAAAKAMGGPDAAARLADVVENLGGAS